MSKNEDKPKAPPSQFSEQPEEKFTKGILILTDDDANGFKIVEEFSHNGIDYKPEPGLAPNLIMKVAKELELRAISSSVVDQLLNAGIEVASITGKVKLSFPQLLGNIVADMLMRRIQEDKVKHQIIMPRKVN